MTIDAVNVRNDIIVMKEHLQRASSGLFFGPKGCRDYIIECP